MMIMIMIMIMIIQLELRTPYFQTSPLVAGCFSGSENPCWSLLVVEVQNAILKWGAKPDMAHINEPSMVCHPSDIFLKESGLGNTKNKCEHLHIMEV
jgi:hypothetical protein